MENDKIDDAGKEDNSNKELYRPRFQTRSIEKTRIFIIQISETLGTAWLERRRGQNEIQKENFTC